MELEAFVDQMIVEHGFDREGPDVVAQIKADLLESLERRIDAMILESLPPEQLDRFEAVIDAGSDSTMQAFLKRHIPDLENRVASVLVSFRTNYL